MPTKSPTKKRPRESTAERDGRLAVERGSLVENKRDTATGDEPATDDKAVAVHWFSRWKLQYGGPNPFLYRGFVLYIARPDGAFAPNDVGDAPPMLASLPDGKRFRALREACYASLEDVAERLEIPPEMLTAFEDGDTFVLRHINPNTLLRLASAFTIGVQAGPPPAPVEAAPEPPPVEAKVIGGEGWPDQRFLEYVEVEDPHYGGTIVGNPTALRVIVRGDYPYGPLPLLDRIPPAGQVKRLRESVATLTPSFIADLLSYPPYPLAELGEAFLGGAPDVGAVLRLFGAIAAYNENHKAS